MGWSWNEDGDHRPGIGEIFSRNEIGGGERCSTRRMVKSQCRTEEVEPGRFIRKCDKTEQLLRECTGRPAEVVESNTEHTEEDVTEEIENGRHHFESSDASFKFPGLRSDIQAIERELFGGFSDLLEAAEEMADGFFRSFRIPPWHGGESPPQIRGRHGDTEAQVDKQENNKNGPTYSGLSGEIRDV